jgi:hypothetical protein
VDGEALFGAVVLDDDRAPLRDDAAERCRALVRDQRADPFSGQQASAAANAELETVRFEQEHGREIDRECLRGDLGNVLQQDLGVARVDREPADLREVLAVARALQACFMRG